MYVTRECFTRAIDAMVELHLDCVLKQMGLAEVFDFLFWWCGTDVHPLNCCCDVFRAFDVVLEFLFSWSVIASRAPLWLW